jgi:transcriptional regulator with PAS, ATPase and Fis domain
MPLKPSIIGFSLSGKRLRTGTEYEYSNKLDHAAHFISESSSMDAILHRADQRTARKPERRESSFLDTIVGHRGSLRSILNQLEVVAGAKTTVLVTGETGTGKEVIAFVPSITTEQTGAANAAGFSHSASYSGVVTVKGSI